MVEKRILTPEELALAAELYTAGRGVESIARQLKCGRRLLYNAMQASGMEMKRGTRPIEQTPRDPVSNYPIGEVPKGHPLYEADQQMLRASTRRESVSPWRNSSLAMD